MLGGFHQKATRFNFFEAASSCHFSCCREVSNQAPITVTIDLPESKLVVWLTVMLVPSVAVEWCPGINSVRPLRLTEAIPRKSPFFLSESVWKIPPSSNEGQPAVSWEVKWKSSESQTSKTKLHHWNHTILLLSHIVIKIKEDHDKSVRHVSLHPVRCL